VCVHIRIILRARGCYRHVKVPSSPYKRGRKGTCKRIQTFLELVLLAERFTVSLRPNLVRERVEISTRVRVVIRILRVPPNTPKICTHLHCSCCFMRARTQRSTIQRCFSAECRPSFSSSPSPLPGCLHHGDIGLSAAASTIEQQDGDEEEMSSLLAL
jgi:hypothetical protein